MEREKMMWEKNESIKSPNPKVEAFISITVSYYLLSSSVTSSKSTSVTSSSPPAAPASP